MRNISYAWRGVTCLWAWCLFASGAFGQTAPIKGRVTSGENNEPLPGVNVIFKGTTTGVTTDADGVYSITPTETGNALVFSYIGYATQEVPVNGRSEINVTLTPDVKSLNEVVVTAIGLERDKKSLGYSVTEVQGDELVRAREPNVVAALAGKVAGVQINSNGGSPGASASIRIRGIASITGNNSPLFVVDGIPINNSQNLTTSTGDINGGVAQSNRAIDLNPNDIADLTVLKGPAATALYGIRAANGAVIITTKKGRQGGRKMNVNFSSSFVIDQVNRYQEPQLRFAQGALNAQGQVTYLDPSSGNANAFGPLLDTLRYSTQPSKWDRNGAIVGQSDPTALPDARVLPYDNIANFFVLGKTYDNNLSISGGGENASYYFSAGRLSQSGIIPLTDFERNSFRITGDVNLTDKIKLSGSANYVNSGGRRSQQGSNPSGIGQALLRYATPSFDITNGLDKPYNQREAYRFPDGTQRSVGGGVGSPDNPYWTLNMNPFRDAVDRVIGYSQLDYDVLPWMKLTYRAGLDFFNETRTEVLSRFSRAAPAGRIQEITTFQRDVNSDLLLTFSRDLFPSLNATLVLGHNYYGSYTRSQSSNGEDLTIPDFFNLGAARTVFTGSGIFRRKLVAGYADVRLSYRDFLFFNFTGRNEWSSTLPQSNNSFFYPAFSAGYVFTENFGLKDNAILSFGKLRASYASVGKDAGIYQLSTVFTGAGVTGNQTLSGGVAFPFRGQPGRTIGNTAGGGENLRPEQNNTVEAGLELRFLRDRISLDVAYYSSVSKDQILPVNIPGSTGFTNTIINAGEVTNKGVEVLLTATPIQTSAFTWQVSANFSANRSKVVRLAPGLSNITLVSIGPLASTRIIPGQPYGVLWGGSFLEDGNGNLIIDDNPTVNGRPNPNYGFPVRNPQDGIIGDPNPDWIGGLRNTFSFKGFTLSGLLDVRYGSDVWNGTRAVMVQSGTAKETEERGQPKVFAGIKQNEGTPNDITVTPTQTWYQGNGGPFSGNNKPFVEDGSWVRLRELTLSYALPGRILPKKFISSAEISLTGRNLLLLTDYSGADPETGLRGDVNGSLGVDYFTNPNTRSYGVNLRISL